jgi:outer membrane protein insertion porin family
MAYEKDRFSGRAVAADERNLPALGLIESAAPETRASDTPNVIDVTYHVRERPRFEYFLGGSSNGVQGTYGSASLTARDLLGRGERWDLEGDLGNRFGNFSINYLDPFSLGRHLAWGSTFVRQEIEYPDDTSDDSSSFSLRFLKPLGHRWQAQSGFQLAGFELGTSLTEPVPFLTPFIGQRFRSQGVNLSFGYEGRNQPVFPTRGTQFLIGSEVSGGVLGGNVSLYSLRSRAQQLVPLRGRHLISLRGRFDAVWPFGETEENGLPRFERLFLGSEDDMRGFPIREVGPKTAAGVPIGGDRLVYASVEYQFAFHRRARLVGFFDLGNVYALDLPDQGLPALRYDAGGEFRIEAPILSLPLRFGYGFNLDRLAGEPKGRFFFSLSARF